MSELETLRKYFPVIIEVPVAWGEMDSLGHVNNIVCFRYFESVRMAYFERVGFLEEMKKSGVGPILATTTCRFRVPLAYPDRVHVGASVRNVKEDRFTMRYDIVSETHAMTAADGDGLIVAYDYHAKKKAPLPDGVRDKIAALEKTDQDLAR